MVGCFLWEYYWKDWAYEAPLNLQFRNLSNKPIAWHINGFEGLLDFVVYYIQAFVCYFHWILVCERHLVSPHTNKIVIMNIYKVEFILQFQGIQIFEKTQWQLSYKTTVREIKDSQVGNLSLVLGLSKIWPQNLLDRKRRSFKFGNFPNQVGKVSLNWLLLTSITSNMWNSPPGRSLSLSFSKQGLISLMLS